MANANRLRKLSLDTVLPGIAQLRRYDRSWFRGDIVAGLILSAFLIPQGMAYAKLAGLPPVNGLYASLIPLLIYAVLGPSRVLILAPDSAIAPMVAVAILPLAAAGDMEERVRIAGLLAVMVGLICLVGGILGVGFLTDLISRPVRVGHLAGIAITVIVSQLPGLLGVDTSGDQIVDTLRQLASSLGEIGGQTAAMGIGSLIAILVLRKAVPRLPSALIVVVAAIALNRFLDLSVEDVGAVPKGLPAFTLPVPNTTDLSHLALPAVAIAIMAFADTSILSRAYARRLETGVDSNQELRALGGANAIAGMFQGFPISSSSSRTPIAEDAGARTPLVGVVGAAMLGVVLLFATNAFADIPTATLAAILVVAAINLFDIPEFKRLWQIHRTDFYLAIAAVVGVALAGVLWGIGIAIALSIAAFLWRIWHPHVAVLGRAPGVKGYHDTTRYPDAAEIPGLLIFRFDAPIFFANAEIFRDALLAAYRSADQPIHRVVIAAEPITDLDSTAADMLAALDKEFDQMQVFLAFAELRDPMKDLLHDFGLYDAIGREHFYQTLGQAVRAYVTESGVDWVDWEDDEAKALKVIEVQPRV